MADHFDPRFVADHRRDYLGDKGDAMRWQKDIIDMWCADWAMQRRRMLGISELQPKERIGRLGSTLGTIRDDRDGASQGTVTQSFPEVYIGPPPNYPLLVNRAWQRMDKRWREIIEVHYVYTHMEGKALQSKQKAALLDISMRLYWQYLTFGKNFVESYVTCFTELSGDDHSVSLTTQNIVANA
jgi:hypothetical protein